VPDAQLNVKIRRDIENVREALAIGELISHVEAAQRSSCGTLVVPISRGLCDTVVDHALGALDRYPSAIRIATAKDL
jgi:hypothetical protein